MAINKTQIIGLPQSKTESEVIEINPGALVLHPDPTNASIQRDGLVYTNPNHFTIQEFNISDDPQCVGIDYTDGNRPIWRRTFRNISTPAKIDTNTISLVTDILNPKKYFIESGYLNTDSVTNTSLNFSTSNSTSYFCTYLNKSDNKLSIVSKTGVTNYLNIKMTVTVLYTLENEENKGHLHLNLPKLPNIRAEGVETLSGRLDIRNLDNIKPTYVQYLNIGTGSTTGEKKQVVLSNLIPDLDSVIPHTIKICFVYTNGSYFYLNTLANNANSIRLYYFDPSTNIITLESSVNDSNIPYFAEIEYTKLSDTHIPFDPIMNLQVCSSESGEILQTNIQSLDFSNEPQCVGIDYTDGNRPIWRRTFHNIPTPTAINTDTTVLITDILNPKKYFIESGSVNFDNSTIPLNFAQSTTNYIFNYLKIQDNELLISSKVGLAAYLNIKMTVTILYTLEDEENQGLLKCNVPKLPNIRGLNEEVLSGRLDLRDPDNIRPTYLKRVYLCDLVTAAAAGDIREISLTSILPEIESLIIEGSYFYGEMKNSKTLISLNYALHSSVTRSRSWAYDPQTKKLVVQGTAQTAEGVNIYGILEYTKTSDTVIPYDPILNLQVFESDNYYNKTEIQEELAKNQSLKATFITDIQDFNSYITPGIWEFSPFAHINGPPAYSTTTVTGGILRVTTSRNPILRVFQEYMVWMDNQQQSIVYTRGWHGDLNIWGPWVCNSSFADYSRYVSHVVPTSTEPLIMPYDGWVVAALTTTDSVTRSALTVDGFEVYMLSFPSNMTVKVSSPLIKKGASVWISGTSEFFWTIPTIGS